MYYRNSKTTLHTGLYGKTAAKTVRLLIEGLRESIGWSENDPYKTGRHFTGKVTTTRVDATNEVLLDVSDYEITGQWAKYNAYNMRKSAYSHGLDTAFVKGWLAAELKRRAQGCSKTDSLQLHPASKTSQTSRGWEIYATADALLGATSEDLDSRYGAGTGEKVVGAMADPIKTEVNEVIVEETKRIKAEFEQKRRDKHMDILRKIAEVRKEYRGLVAELGKQERAAVTAMKKDILSV